MWRQVGRLSERFGRLELRGDAGPYAQAIGLAAKGTGTQSLVSCFRLTEGEANLVRLPHGKHGQGAAPSQPRRGRK